MDGGQLDGNFITYGLCLCPVDCELLRSGPGL